MDREKAANLKQFIGRAITHTRGGKGLEYLRKFKHPTHNFNPASVNSKIDMPQMQRGKANISRGIRTSIGNTADSLSRLTKGVKGKGVLGGTAQLGRNAFSLGKNQVRGDLYKEVHNPVMTQRGGKKFVKSKWAFGKDKEVVGETSRGTAIARRRKLFDPVSLAIGGSGPSIGAASYALGDKEQPKSRRAADAAMDTALFSVSMPLGIGAALTREGLKDNKKQNNKLKEKN